MNPGRTTRVPHRQIQIRRGPDPEFHLDNKTDLPETDDTPTRHPDFET